MENQIIFPFKHQVALLTYLVDHWWYRVRQIKYLIRIILNIFCSMIIFYAFPLNYLPYLHLLTSLLWLLCLAQNGKSYLMLNRTKRFKREEQELAKKIEDDRRVNEIKNFKSEVTQLKNKVTQMQAEEVEHDNKRYSKQTIWEEHNRQRWKSYLILLWKELIILFRFSSEISSLISPCYLLIVFVEYPICPLTTIFVS